MNEKVSDVGIDETPTSESSNLIKSGGVYQALQDKSDWVTDTFAKKDGYYEKLGSGTSDQLTSPDGTIDSPTTDPEFNPFINRTTAGNTSIGSGNANFQKFEGKTLKWNQLVEDGNFTNTNNWTGRYSTASCSNNICTVTPASNGTERGLHSRQNINVKSGHRYIISVDVKSPIDGTIYNSFYGTITGGRNTAVTANVWKTVSNLINSTQTNSYAIYSLLNEQLTTSQSLQFKNLICIDLTEMFGSVIADSMTVEQFEALYPLNYYPYTATPKLLNVNPDGLKTIGFNQWDEEWELGTLDVSGQPSESSTNIRSKNYISCFPSTSYYANNLFGVHIQIAFYDANKSFISWSTEVNDVPFAFSTPVNARYMRFRTNSTITEYTPGQLCINLSWSGYRNGEYEPYWSQTKDLTWIRSLEDGNGNLLFPDGLKSAGSVFDEIDFVNRKAIKRLGSVDLGDLSYQLAYNRQHTFRASDFSDAKIDGELLSAIYVRKTRNAVYDGVDLTMWYGDVLGAGVSNLFIVNDAFSDAATFKTAMSGVMLYYELTTPIEIDLPDDINFTYKEDDFGTEEFIPSVDANGNPQTAPVPATIKYLANLRDNLRTIIRQGNVAYNEEQILTDNQKTQARENIDAAGISGVYPSMVVGNANNLTGRGTVPAEYTFRTSGGDADLGTGTATINKMKGDTLVWNQKCDFNLFTPSSNCTASDRTASSVTLTLNTSGDAKVSRYDGNKGHKIYVKTQFKASATGCIAYIYLGSWSAGYNINSNVEDTDWHTLSGILTQADGSNTIEFGFSNTIVGETYQFRNPLYIDLTLMFGAGNEPSTLEQFEALYPESYYPYTSTPQLINVTASGIKTTGFNQWDEEWEIGSINSSTGEKEVFNSTIRSKGFVAILPETNFYTRMPSNYDEYSIAFRYYKKDGTYIGYSDFNGNTNGANTIRKTPRDCYMIRFVVSQAYGTTYNHDICINLSWSGYRNGEYEPYEEHILYFNGESGDLTTVTGKLNGEGESVVVFPDGMRSCGSTSDEIGGYVNGYLTKAIKRIGVVDLGDLDWAYYEHIWQGPTSLSGFATPINSIPNIKKNNPSVVPTAITSLYSPASINSVYSGGNDKTFSYGGVFAYLSIVDTNAGSNSDAFKAAMKGVKLYYELETPEEYTLDTPIPANYYVNDFGTEERLPADTASSVAAPILYDVQYAMNAVDTIRRLPVNYISKESFTNFCTSLSTALGTALNSTVTITPTYNTEQQEYSYNITIVPNE